MKRNQKLELTWIGKEDRAPYHPRILLEDYELSHTAPYRRLEGDEFENHLIFGDNLPALLALEKEFAKSVKCIFIDPPYNTGGAFDHYDDAQEHSLWLSFMRDRLEVMRRLLSEDGSIWITIDDNEAHYLKVLCDEIFGRKAFLANIVWQKRTSRENRAVFGSAHDHVLVYAPLGAQKWKNVRNRLPATDSGFSNPDNDARGLWRSIPFSAQGYRPNQMYPIHSPAGALLEPPKGRCWGATEPVFRELLADKRVYFPNGGKGRPRIKQFAGEQDGLVPSTWWPASIVGDNEAAKKEALALVTDVEAFSTPKPERLLCKILHIATDPGDVVLDAFAGSGTTGAVAHKMGRRWIMIESGDHIHTHIIPRMRKVIDGHDPGGVTEEVGWSGGGGFRYSRLALPLLEKDLWGNWVIDPKFDSHKLVEAVCLLEGYTYGSNNAVFWQHGYRTEHEYIYVTTHHLTPEQLRELSEWVGDGNKLLIVHPGTRMKRNGSRNLIIKPIPEQILSRYERNPDAYAVRTQNLPIAQKPPSLNAQGGAQSSLFESDAR